MTIRSIVVHSGGAYVGAGGGITWLSEPADEVAEVAGWLSPRIGGVGAMTRAFLLMNTVEAAERAAGAPADTLDP